MFNISLSRSGAVSITTKVVSSSPVHGEVYSLQHYVIRFIDNDLQQVCGFLKDYPVSSANKSDHHHIAEILLKVVLNTITITISLHQFLVVYNYPFTEKKSIISSFYICNILTQLLCIIRIWLADVRLGLGLWCLMPLSTIFQLYHGNLNQFYWWRKTGVAREDHWQTLSHNVVSSTPHHERDLKI
jgi:magnesium-transporting ATPase (P-type)